MARYDEINKIEILNKIQVDLHSILRKYFSINTVPLYKSIECDISNIILGKNNINKIYEVINNINILNKFYNIESFPDLYRFDKNSNYVNLNKISQFLSNSYFYFDKILKMTSKSLNLSLVDKSHKIIPFNKNDYSNSDYFSSLFRLLEISSKSQLGNKYILFGSLSDLDVAYGFTDCDNLNIISKKNILNKCKLIETRKEILKMNKYIYNFNILHHHDSFIFTEIDMRYYSQSFFPLILFSYSKLLTKTQRNKNFLFLLRKDSDENKDRLLRKLKKIKSFDYKKNKNIWHYMRHIADYFLIFSLYLQFLGEPTYKKHSFEKVKNLHPELDWGLYDLLTNIRNNEFGLAYFSFKKFRFLGKYNPRLISYIIKKMNYIPKNMSKIFSDKLFLRMSKSIVKLEKIIDKIN